MSFAANDILNMWSFVLGMLQYTLNIVTALETTENEIVGRESCQATQKNQTR